MDGEVKGAEQQGADGDSTANQRDGNGQPTDDKGGTETQGNHINGHDRPSNYVVAVSRIGPGKEAVEADNGDVNPMDVRVTHPSGSQPINAGFGTLGDGPSGLGLLPDPFDDVEDSDLFIHPLFLAPPSARPDRNLGLPEAEAEDVRRLVQLYVQKQEEICRGATRLHKGLLKADRLRRTVLQWAKAEAHCGPHRDMSDGEDWYDKDEWGLTEDLKKGQDEEEEDTHTTAAAQQQKKTRNRR